MGVETDCVIFWGSRVPLKLIKLIMSWRQARPPFVLLRPDSEDIVRLQYLLRDVGLLCRAGPHLRPWAFTGAQLPRPPQPNTSCGALEIAIGAVAVIKRPSGEMVQWDPAAAPTAQWESNGKSRRGSTPIMTDFMSAGAVPDIQLVRIRMLECQVKWPSILLPVGT